MILREHHIDLGKVTTFNLYPVGDLQFGAPGFDEALWKQWTETIRKDPNALTIGMGDYSDHWRPTNQAKIAGITAYDKEFKDSLDEMYRTHNRKILAKLERYIKPGRCLGLLSGHHEYTYASGISSTQELCEWLRVPYLSELGFIRLTFGSSRIQWKCVIHAQHGQGGASFINSDVPNIERKTAPYWDADLFLRGHSTKKWAAPIPIMRMNEKGMPRLVAFEKWMVNTGGFMRGFLEGEPTYVSKSNMPPAALGYVVVHLKLQRTRTGLMKRDRNIQISVTQ